MRARLAVVTGVLLAMLGGLLASPALATPPVTLGSGFVTDQSGVLTPAEVSTLNDRLGTLSQERQMQLFVVLVDDFTDPSDRRQWADAVASDNGLGSSQYLLAIATQGRQYYISADSAGPMSTGSLSKIEQSLLPDLQQDRWAAAILTAAEGFQGTDEAGGGWGGLLLLGLLVVAVVVVIWFVLRARRRKTVAGGPTSPEVNAGPPDPFAEVSDEELATRAGSALVQTDDAIRSSTEDLGFATAQFGDEATASFTAVVTEAKTQLDEAFSLKQKLDDEIPDSPAQRRAWHIRIIELCQAADEALEANVESFDALRRLEQDAEQALQQVSVHRGEVAAAIDAAPAALQRLEAVYDASALSTVADNPEQARSRLQLADAHIAEAGEKLAAGQRGEAAFAIRTAEEGLVQAQQMTEAIGTLGTGLAAAEEQARALMADLEGDLSAVSSLPPSSELQQIATATRSQLDEASANLDGSARRPQATLEALTAANMRIDSAVDRIRNAQQQAERAGQILDQTLLQARSEVATANDFIATRRGAVGATARTRAAEASAELSRAEAARSADPAQAQNHAKRAISLAQTAVQGAQSDLSGFSAGGMQGGVLGGGGGGNLAGDIIGGIIGGILAGGGSGGSHRSSGPSGWRSSGGGRGFSPSSFGGSRGRSGGGRF